MLFFGNKGNNFIEILFTILTIILTFGLFGYVVYKVGEIF
jgi:hypothetical protein